MTCHQLCPLSTRKSTKRKADSPRSPMPYRPGKLVGCTRMPVERGNFIDVPPGNFRVRASYHAWNDCAFQIAPRTSARAGSKPLLVAFSRTRKREPTPSGDANGIDLIHSLIPELSTNQ